MKRSILQAKFYLLFVILSLASCTQDELAEQGAPLPDGMYPMTFTAVQQAPQPGTPQTRVSDTDNGTSITSSWTDGDKIKVTVGNNDSYSAETTCALNADGSITSYDPQLYWQTTGDYTIDAYYSNVPGENATVSNPVNFVDQSKGLAYVLKATPVTGTYQSKDIQLKFTHQLAKVRVKLENGTYDKDLSKATVKVKGHTTCNVDEDVMVSGSGDGYITMRKNGDYYEANLVPGNIKDFEISANDKTTTASLSNAKTVYAGNVYTLTITLNEKYDEVKNISDISNSEYTVRGNVHLIGGENPKDLKLIMEAGSKLTLEGVKLSPNTDGNAITCQGDATITLKGNNELSGKYVGADNGYSAILVNSGTLTIKGDDNAKLTATGIGRVAGGAGIGAKNGANIIIESGTIIATGGTEAAGIGSAGFNQPRMGDITIKGGTIEAKGGLYSAGIGGSNSGACGDILITGGNIKAYGGLQSPGIGCGDAGACRNITITGGTIIATKGSNSPASIGACLATDPEGTVTIDRNKAHVTEN